MSKHKLSDKDITTLLKIYVKKILDMQQELADTYNFDDKTSTNFYLNVIETLTVTILIHSGQPESIHDFFTTFESTVAKKLKMYHKYKQESNE